MGFQDVTRRGLKESDIEYLCDLMLDVVKRKRKPAEARKDVIALRQNFKGIKYGFQSVNEVIDNLKKYA